MSREYKMPKTIENKLRAIYDAEKHGDIAEVAVIDAASELGYEVEDETETHTPTERGTWMHNVKFVKREPGPWGEKVSVGWAHFNHPGPDYEDHRDEWYMYFL